MDSTPQREPRVLWSFWLACGLAATGAIVPLVLAAGDTGRISGVAIPFGIAAIAMAANALTYPRGRSLATALYVVAWIAVVYGILRMIAVPLQLVVVGICPTSESVCAPGFAHPFNSGESAGIIVGILTGALALQVGFFGLRVLYRRPRQQQAFASTSATAPPIRVVAPHKTAPSPLLPIGDPAAAAPSAAADQTETASPVSAPLPVRKPRTNRPPKPAAELPAPSEAAELPPHPEPAELPPHSSTSEPDPSTTSSS